MDLAAKAGGRPSPASRAIGPPPARPCSRTPSRRPAPALRRPDSRPVSRPCKRGPLKPWPGRADAACARTGAPRRPLDLAAAASPAPQARRQTMARSGDCRPPHDSATGFEEQRDVGRISLVVSTRPRVVVHDSPTGRPRDARSSRSSRATAHRDGGRSRPVDLPFAATSGAPPAQRRGAVRI